MRSRQSHYPPAVADESLGRVAAGHAGDADDQCRALHEIDSLACCGPGRPSAHAGPAVNEYRRGSWTRRQVLVNVSVSFSPSDAARRSVRVNHPPPRSEDAMAGRLAGKAIIVTGAGSGMGRAFAMGLAREGATVGVLDVNEDAVRIVCAEVRAQSLEAVPLWADVSRRDQVVAAFGRFVAEAGRLDVLFNNAGFNKPLRLLDVTEENWHAIM